MVVNGQEKGSKWVEMLKQNSSEDEKAHLNNNLMVMNGKEKGLKNGLKC